MSKILIIKCETDKDECLSSLLKDAGYYVLVTYNEEQALNIANEQNPDITLIDTACNNVDIITLCRKLKSKNQTNDIQIILLTSNDSPSEEILVGADGYITKPLNENIVIATINAHLRIKKLLDILYTNNSELAKSLYQLNVLYNTSSQDRKSVV